MDAAAHHLLFDDFHAPGGGPLCSYRGEGQPREIICAECAKAFTSDTPMTEVIDEAVANGFDIFNEEMISICDDCYRAMTTFMPLPMAPEVERMVKDHICILCFEEYDILRDHAEVCSMRPA